MERGKTSTKTAGVDVGKRWLDVAVHGLEDSERVSNDAACSTFSSVLVNSPRQVSSTSMSPTIGGTHRTPGPVESLATVE